MEKLSIEQKAKAYDELLIKLQKAKVDDNVCDEMYYRVIDNIVPELKESEDERVRKWLIDTIKAIPNDSIEWEIIDKSNVLAWLEKRGEQKLLIEKLPEEMKTIGESLGFTTQEECDNYNQMVTDLIMSDDDKNEQKPAWSEEDEAIWAEISDLIREGYKQSDSKFSWDDIRNWVNTKLLKGRVQLQNITVTDEELAQAKKEAYNDALDKIEYHSGEPTFDDGWGAAIWYLKNRNAQPQNTWKPSDEQMEAFENFVRGIWESCYDSPYENKAKLLYSLLEQLKKLK